MASLNKISTNYFDRLFVHKTKSEERKPRVLLLDKHTAAVLSMSYSQSQLLQQDVILIELIDKQHSLKQMKNLDCIVYIKPTTESLNYLAREVAQPHFSKYQVYFNNVVSKQRLEKLAELDDFEVITRVMELFQDYQVVNDNLFQVNEVLNTMTDHTVIDESNSIVSLLLALKRCPIIAYESNLVELRKLSSEILYNINLNSNNNLFDDLNRHLDTPPILLLLDRQNDPITPLISPWTYQSMIHEFIGIKNNTIKLPLEKDAVVLADKFYQLSVYLNYGDVTDKFQKYVEEYKKETKQTNIDSSTNLDDLKKMLTKFPEYKKLSQNILKHLNILSELDRQINLESLWQIGELQQIIAGNLENHQSIKNKIIDIFNNPRISTINKVKLLILFIVRFPRQQNEIDNFIKLLSDAVATQPVITRSQQLLLESFKKLFPTYNFETASDHTPAQNTARDEPKFFNKAKINNLFGGGNTNSDRNDNIYMQYSPRLRSLLTSLITNRLSQMKQLTVLTPDKVTSQYGPYDGVIQDIIVYFKGGVTYEEARIVHELQQAYPNVNLIIGGDEIVNSNDWLELLYDKVNDMPQLSAAISNNQEAMAAQRSKNLLEIL